MCCSTSCGDVTESRDGCHDDDRQVSVAKQPSLGNDNNMVEAAESDIISDDESAADKSQVLSADKLAMDDDVGDLKIRIEQLMSDKSRLSEELDLMKTSLVTADSKSHMSVLFTYLIICLIIYLLPHRLAPSCSGKPETKPQRIFLPKCYSLLVKNADFVKNFVQDSRFCQFFDFEI